MYWIAAICEVDKNRRDSAKHKIQAAYSGKSDYKFPNENTGFREITDRDDIHAVLIATPDAWLDNERRDPWHLPTV